MNTRNRFMIEIQLEFAPAPNLKSGKSLCYLLSGD